jgi:CheY-like chemotaxis protein
VNTGTQNTRDTLTPWRILLVEDDNATRESAAIKLTKEGFEVIASEDGVAALKVLTKDSNFSAVLLDLRMPRGDGFWFLEEKNKLENVKDIPVLIFTNLNQKEHIERAITLGAKGYLVKAHHGIQQIVDEVKSCLINKVCKIDF